MATVLDHYTTSFNYSQTNFAAIWLRPWWYLVTDSAVTDSQYGGLNFVTGGGYTRSDAPAGYWSLAYRSVFIGTSQAGDDPLGTPANAYASNAGPFNPASGLKCNNSGISSCVSVKDGIAMQLSDFPGQRMFSIYDGPAFQQDNAYLDVYPTFLEGCTPAGKAGGTCAESGWMYGRVRGVLKTKLAQYGSSPCYLPNAAIGWKQPNGFYYPPAFHSLNLYFRNTNVRHFVVEPSFAPGTFQTDMVASYDRYCNFAKDFFNGFTDIDRQTVLNDGLPTLYENGKATGRGDGTLTGLTANDLNKPATTARETISVNEDGFFNAPKETVECASDLHASDQDGKGAPGSAKTSPYEYPTIGVIADCAIGGPPNQCAIDGKSYWGADCGSSACFGPRLYRQYLTNAEWNAESTKPTPSIHMMGQGNGQRSTLTLNHGHYYLDTTPDCKFQTGGGDCPPGNARTPAVSVFLAGHSYHLYLVYGRPDTTQTYDIFIGKSPSNDWSVTPERSIFNDNNFQFKDAGASEWLTVDNTHIADLGIVRVTINLNKSKLAEEFSKELDQFCKPTTYCAVNQTTGACGCKPGTNCKDDAVCSWGPADPDCPETGCYGFSVKMPGNFQALQTPPPPPPTQLFSSDPYFATDKVTFGVVGQDKAGEQCYYSSPPMH